MADIFDQIHAHATGTGVVDLPDAPRQPDIFDQIHSHITGFQGDSLTPLPQGTEFSIPQDQAEETARRRAAAQISDIESGRTFTKTPGPNGETNYQYETNPASWRASTGGRKLSNSEKLAIYQAHRQAVVGRPENVQSYEQMAGQIKQESNKNNTPLENFGGGLGTSLAAPVAGLTGLVNPNAGNRMQEDIASTYAGDPDTVAGMAGRITGGTVAAAPAILGGPAGGTAYAALMGSQAAGEARMEVAKARASGQNVSHEQEIAYALDKALIAAATGKITAGAIAGGGPVMAANPVLNAGLGAVKAAGVGGVDMAANAAAGNLAAIGTGVDPNRDIGAGVDQAALEGSLGAAVGHGLHVATSKQPPNLREQIPNENTSPERPNREVYQKAIEDNLRRQMGVDKLAETKAKIDELGKVQDQQIQEHTPPLQRSEFQPLIEDRLRKQTGMDKLAETKAKIDELGAQQDEQLKARTQTPENPEPPPAKTYSAQDMLDYIKVKNDRPYDEGATRMLVADKTFEKKMVPLDQIGKDFGTPDEARVADYAKQEGKNAPPVVLGDENRPIDGKHRIAAARARGETAIEAYVPVKEQPKSLKAQLDAAFAESDARMAAEEKNPPAAPAPAKKTLPKIEGMAEMSYKQLKEKAKAAGYDTTGKMNFSSVKRAVESQHADSLIDLPRPPKAAKDWTAKQYKYWAEQKGYNITDESNRYDVARQINQQRKAALRAAAGKPPRPPKPTTPASPPAGPSPAPVSGATKTHTPSGVEHYATPIIRQMEDINKPLAGKVFEASFEGRRQGAEWQAELAPHTDALKKYFKGKDTFPFQKAVYEGDIAKAKTLVPAELSDSVDALFKSSKTALEYRKSVGAETPELKNHVHFEVKDYKALQKVLGKTDPGPIQEAWNQELARTGKPLSEDRKVEIANAVLNGFGPRIPGRMKAGFKKERGANFTRATEDLYRPVWESQQSYLMHAAEDAQNTKMLGKDYTEMVKGPSPLQGQAFANTSLGKIMTQEVNAGRLSGEDAARFKDLLNTHLTSKTASNAVKTTRDLINFATLTHIGTAIKQIGDVGFTAYKYGLKNTVKGTKLSLGKSDQNVMMRELGLDDVSHEMRDAGKLGNSVSKWMHMTGMMKLDILAKETRANAAILNHQEAIKTPEGEKKFASEYKSFLGDKYDQTVKDLKAGERTWHTDLLAAHELSKSQPLYRVNMTPGQAKSEGIGRLAYALKPFMLHQLDTVRREIFRNLATPGQRATGLKNMAGMIGALSLANLGTNAITNLMNGKDQSFTEQAADSVLGIANLSSYAVKNGIKDPGGFILKFIGPPTPVLGDLAHDIRGDMFKAQTKRVFKDGKWQEETTHTFQGSATVRNLPHLLGTLAYYWTPLGAGYHLEEKQAKDEFRQKLGDLKKAAEDADASGEDDVAKTLIDTYNAQAAKDPDKKTKQISSGTLNRAKTTSMRTQRKAPHATQSE